MEVESFHTQSFGAEIADRSAGAELVAAVPSTEVANIAGEGMKEGKRVRVPGCHIHGLDGLAVGGDDKRKDRRSS